MHVIVIGAGIVGVTTAYYLADSGATVTVLERHAGVAHETSFANAGVIAPGYVTPWAGPGMPQKIASFLFKRHAPVIVRPRLEWAQWDWARRWLRECDLERYRANRARMQRIALYSRTQLHALRERHELAYEQTQGYLQLFRSERDATLAAPGIATLAEAGIAHQRLTPEECRRREPGMSDMAFEGGLYVPGDESGNCALFARLVKDLGVAAGVDYRFRESARQIEPQGRGVRVHAATGVHEADAVVVAGGVDSGALLKPLGMRVPLYPIQGYSATVRIKEPSYAPLAAVMDESYKVAITRMGERIRVAGIAEFGARGLKQRDSALRTLIKVVRDWFPGSADFSGATYWAGERPMLPDGPPVLGATPVPGVFLNLGHGSTGWAMACGSGRVVADIVSGRAPEISLEGLTLARYAQAR